MMIIKKHIIKEWVKYFLGALLMLILLLTIANIISGILRTSVSFLEVLSNHIIELPGFASKIIPIACLIGSLFSINQLKMRNELTAIFASGFSRRDFILTLVLVSSFAGLLQFTLSGYIHPLAKSKKDFFIEDPGDKFGNLKSKGLMSSTIKSGKLWYKSQDYFISFSAFDKQQQILKGVTLFKLGKNKSVLEKIEAKTMKFQDSKWLIEDAFISRNLDKKQFINKEPYTKKSYDLNIDIAEFNQADADITTLNVNELHDYIEHLKENGINTNEYRVMYWDKFSSSLVCIAFALLASIGIFVPNRRSSSFGRTVVGVLVFTLIYWFVYSYATEAGKSSRIDAMLSCFMVPALFFVYLTKVFFKHRTLR